MIDIHTHIMPGVDDGAKDIKETFSLMQEAEETGITDIFLTNHYMEGYYECEKNETIELLTLLQEKLRIENVPLTLHLRK